MIIHPRQNGETDSLSGNTPAAWTSVLDWNTAGLGDKTIVLVNTDAANALSYRVLVRSDYTNGQDFIEVAAVVMLAGTGARIALNNHHARVRVQVQQVGGLASTYQVDYIGMPYR